MIKDAALTSAREAARAFCLEFGFSSAELRQIEDPPRSGPLELLRGAARMRVYRWLGDGRGAPYVQVEIDTKSAAVTVYGGVGHEEHGPWRPAL